jgi:hypothetical protein
VKGLQREVKHAPNQELESLYHFPLTVNMEVQAFAQMAKNSSNIAHKTLSIEPDIPRGRLCLV